MNKDEAIKQAMKAAVEAIYFDDISDYATALWEVVTALGGQEAADLLDYDSEAAYEKYCKEVINEQ